MKCVSDFCIKKTEHWSTIVDREPCKCGTCSWYWLFVVQVLTIRGARLQPQSITLLLESCGWTSMVTWILWTIKKEWSATSSIYHTATSHEIYNARWGRHLPYSYFTRDIRDKVRQTLTIQLLHMRYMRQGEADTYHTATSHFKTPAKESLVLHELKQHKPWFGEECLGFFDKVSRLQCSGHRIQVQAV